MHERQQAVLAQLEDELRWKPWLTPDYESIFQGTRLALGGPRRCRAASRAASPAAPPAPKPSCLRSPASVLPFCALEAKLPGSPASSRRRHSAPAEQPSVVSKSGSFSYVPPEPTNIRNYKLTPESFGISFLDEELDLEDSFHSAPPEEVKDNHFSRTVNAVKSKTVSHVTKSGSVKSEFVHSTTKTVKKTVKTVHRGGKGFKPIFAETVFSEPSPLPLCAPVSRAAVVRPSPAPVSVSWVRGAGARLVPAPDSRPGEALLVSASVPAPRVGRAAAQPLPVPIPAPRVRVAMNQQPATPIPTPRVGVTGVRSAPATIPVSRARLARTQPTSAPIPTPRVGVASVRQVPASVPVSAGGIGEPVQPFPLFFGGLGELVQPPANPPLQQHQLLSLAYSLAQLLAQVLAQISAQPLIQPGVSTPAGPASSQPEVSATAGSAPAGGSGESIQLSTASLSTSSTTPATFQAIS